MSADDERNIDIVKSEAGRLLAGERKIHDKTCGHCGVEIHGTGKKKYCSDAHTQAAYYARVVKPRRILSEARRISGDPNLEPPKTPSSLSLLIDLGLATLPEDKRPLAERLIEGAAQQIFRELRKP